MREQLIDILNSYLENQGVEMNDEKFTKVLDQLEEEVEQFIDSAVPQIVQEVL